MWYSGALGVWFYGVPGFPGLSVWTGQFVHIDNGEKLGQSAWQVPGLSSTPAARCSCRVPVFTGMRQVLERSWDRALGKYWARALPQQLGVPVVELSSRSLPGCGRFSKAKLGQSAWVLPGLSSTPAVLASAGAFTRCTFHAHMASTPGERRAPGEESAGRKQTAPQQSPRGRPFVSAN